jgi:hypothetical protein
MGVEYFIARPLESTKRTWVLEEVKKKEEGHKGCEVGFEYGGLKVWSPPVQFRSRYTARSHKQ